MRKRLFFFPSIFISIKFIFQIPKASEGSHKWRQGFSHNKCRCKICHSWGDGWARRCELKSFVAHSHETHGKLTFPLPLNWYFMQSPVFNCLCTIASYKCGENTVMVSFGRLTKLFGSHKTSLSWAPVLNSSSSF